MKSKTKLLTIFTAIFCVTTLVSHPRHIAFGQKLGYAEEPRDYAPDTTTDSPAAFPTPNDHTFVTTSDGNLDTYLTRNQVPAGKLEFNIPITRFFFHPKDENLFDGSGFLTSEATTRLTQNGVLPKNVPLLLRVFDVDNAAACPEVDHLTVNGRMVQAGGASAQLTSGNQVWSVLRFEIPIGDLKLPGATGSGGSPAPALNKISVLIDELDCASPDGESKWALTVDWGAFLFPTASW